jgi:hydroxyacylglutathione hydrolase
MSILVKRLFAYNNLRNFTYIISTDKGEAWVIDPYDAGQVKDEIKSLGVNLKGILNTHDHFDHTRGNQELQDYFKCEVLDFFLNRSIELDKHHSLEVLSTPGHTPDHLVFLWKQNGVYQMIFAGDTLFNAGVGNCKNGGNVDELFETTLKKCNFSQAMIILKEISNFL